MFLSRALSLTLRSRRPPGIAPVKSLARTLARVRARAGARAGTSQPSLRPHPAKVKGSRNVRALPRTERVG